MVASRLRCAVVALVVSLDIACAARTVPGEAVADPAGPRSAEVSTDHGSDGSARPANGAAPVALRAVPSRTALQTAEQWDAALASALARLGESPSPADLVAVAAAYRRLGIGDKAIDYYSRALLTDPECAAAFDGLARVWRDWGFPDVGLGEAYRAVYHAPASPEAQNTLGTVLQALGALGPARERYERAIALDSSAAYARANLCGLELAEGRPERAVAECERALALDAGLEIARQNLARAEAVLARARSGGPHARQ